jgi:PAS domain S-box-containing protein
LVLSVTVTQCLQLVLLPVHAPRCLSIIAAVDGVALAALGMNQRGQTRRASVLLVLALSAIITVSAATAGGIHTPAATYYLTTVFIAGFLLGERWGLATALLCCLGGIFLVIAERSVALSSQELTQNAFALWMGIVLNMAIIIGLQYLAARTARNALEQVEAELAERRRTESALRESEQRYREVFEKTSDGIFLMDVAPEGRFKFVRFNPAEEKSVGVTDQQAAGRYVSEIMPKPVAETMNASFRRCLEAGAPISYEEQLDLPVGRRYFDTSLIPVRDAEGQIYRLVGIAHNITEQKQAAVHLQKSTEQLRALSSRLQTLREEERTRIAREIHDHLGQLLTALNLELHSVRTKAAGLPETDVRTSLTAKVKAATELVNELIRSVQKIASELRPGTLDRLGLEAAIESEAQAFRERTGIQCECSLPTAQMALPREHATALFRIFQEILTNVARHSRATEVMVSLTHKGDSLLLEAEDNGVGIKDSDVAGAKSLGLLGMQERAAILGGKITIRPGVPDGTSVVVQIPLPGKEGKKS